MSASVLLPPNTRLLSGHEMNSPLRSTSVTSISGAHSRMYFAAVAPPPLPAQPATAVTPAPHDIHWMNSRRLIVMAIPLLFLRREVRGELIDLLVGIAFRELVHYGRWALACFEVLHLRHDVA